MSKVYVGTNYHPHDHPFKRIQKDIQLMQENHLEVVRIGHLCWDSFEKEDGCYTFEWFDKVVDLFAKKGIKVIIDIPTRPAPLWLHEMYPEIAIHNEDGIRMRPITRYMEDVGNPDFQKYAFRFARKIVERYSKTEALLAFGLCNEIGSGFSSYSSSAESRFQDWLKKKYRTVEALNTAWSTQRWSRRVNSFSSVIFPINSEKNGAPESYLDMKRFFSDELGEYLGNLKKIVKEIAPSIPTTSNHWAENEKVGFDYLKFSDEFVEIPGIGFYPGINPNDKRSIVGACMYMDHRITDSKKNIWALEFQTGTNGGFSGPKGLNRMYYYLSLIYRNEMVCAWTWDSMIAGEEQYLFGLLNHDGSKTEKLKELNQFSQEIDKVKSLDIFPRKIRPRVAIAYSYESNIITKLSSNYYSTSSSDQVLDLYNILFDLNVDCNIIDLRSFSGNYDILIVPGIAEMEDSSAENIKKFVENGGTVLMTAYSAKVNQNNSVFSTSLPGRLTEIFGVTISGFGRAFSFTPSVNEGGVEKSKMRVKLKEVKILDDEMKLADDIDYYEIINLKTAESLMSLSVDNSQIPACTINRYGNGQALYYGLPVETRTMKRILKNLLAEKNIEFFDCPELVTRKLNSNIYIYINVSSHKQKININYKFNDLIEKKDFVPGEITILPYDVKLIKIEEENKR